MEFKVEVKLGQTPEEDRARVARVAYWGNGRSSTSTWYAAQYIPGYHEWWDHYRARKAAQTVLLVAQAQGGAR